MLRKEHVINFIDCGDTEIWRYPSDGRWWTVLCCPFRTLLCFIPAVKDASAGLLSTSEAGKKKNSYRGGRGSWWGSSITSSFVWSQVQMFQVWLQLHGGPDGTQIPAVAEGGPGWVHVWCNRVWNMFEPVLWHWCKFFTEVSTVNCL